MPWVPFVWVTPRGSGRAKPRGIIARTWRESNELVIGARKASDHIRAEAASRRCRNWWPEVPYWWEDCGECQRLYGCNHPRLPKEIPNFRRHIQKFIEPFPITSIRLRITQVARSLTWQITCCAGWQVPQEAERLRSPRPRAAWQAVRAARPNPARRDQRRWRRAGTAAPRA